MSRRAKAERDRQKREKRKPPKGTPKPKGSHDVDAKPEA